MRAAPRAASVWRSDFRRSVGVSTLSMTGNAIASGQPMGSADAGSGVPAAEAKSRVVVGRLVNRTDFERVLATTARSRSTHFAVHHVGLRPTAPIWRHQKAEEGKLSTDSAPVTDKPVDDLLLGHWLGTVVPKRHARRSVTRSLLKRQIREALASHVGRLAPGMWLVRLRSPFLPAQFPSAASPALRRTARAELDLLLTKAGR